jgi:NAD(P)-dependent dehydrogenase (short-subunit alcohol dehydrogenase family)
MARIFITGSADGLGPMAGQLLADAGHRVTLHARNDARAEAARHALPTAEGVIVGDVSTIDQMREVAESACATCAFDAVIHNVGLGYRAPRRVETADWLEQVFVVNVLAPYLITANMPRPHRLVYLSSVSHQQGHFGLEDPQWKSRPWDGDQAYPDSKLFDLLLALGVARRVREFGRAGMGAHQARRGRSHR